MNEFNLKVKLVKLGSGSGPESPSTDDLAKITNQTMQLVVRGLLTKDKKNFIEQIRFIQNQGKSDLTI